MLDDSQLTASKAALEAEFDTGVSGAHGLSDSMIEAVTRTP